MLHWIDRDTEALDRGESNIFDLFRSRNVKTTSSYIALFAWLIYGVCFYFVGFGLVWLSRKIVGLHPKDSFISIIFIYSPFFASLCGLGWLLWRKFELRESFRIALGASAWCLIPACIAAEVASIAWLLVTVVVDTSATELFSKWWVVCLVYLIWGATLSVVFTRFASQSDTDSWLSRQTISVGFKGSVLVLPVIISAVIAQFGFLIGVSRNLAEEIGGGSVGALPATINPLVIWSSSLWVLAKDCLARSDTPLHLNLKLRLFLTGPPTVVVAAIVVLGWLAGQVYGNLRDPDLQIMIAVSVFCGSIIVTYSLAYPLEKLLVCANIRGSE